MTKHRLPNGALGYGARPVSVDLARQQPLALRLRESPVDLVPIAARPRRGGRAEQLTFRRWPTGSMVLVCSLDGGVGRSTIALQLADLVAGLPYAHVSAPVAALEAEPRRTLHRSIGSGERVEVPGCCRTPTQARRTFRLRESGAHWLVPAEGAPANREKTARLLAQCRSSHSVVVVDAPAGLPSDLYWGRQAPGTAGVVLVIRPDRRSVDEAADALAWMHDRWLLRRERVCVVVNQARAGHGDRAAATALSARCRCVVRIGRLGERISGGQREGLARLGCELWASAASVAGQVAEGVDP